MKLGLKMKQIMEDDNVLVSDDDDSINVADHPKSKSSKDDEENIGGTRLPKTQSSGPDSGVNSFLKFSIQNILQATSTAAAVAAAACQAARRSAVEREKDEEDEEKANKSHHQNSPPESVGSHTPGHLPLW